MPLVTVVTLFPASVYVVDAPDDPIVSFGRGPLGVQEYAAGKQLSRLLFNVVTLVSFMTSKVFAATSL